jgi:hypothetical protein
VLVVALLRNPDKEPLFSVEERLAKLRETAKKWSNVRVDTFEGLLVDYPLFDENLADEGIISVAGIASPVFVMSIPQWNMVFGGASRTAGQSWATTPGDR